MNTTEFEHKNFSLLEAAEHLRISRSTLYRLIDSRQLRPRKIRTRVILTGRELARFIESAKP